MNFLIITQVFYPDTVSVSQHISDLAFRLKEEGHSVDVFTSRYPYEDKQNRYKSNEVIKGVVIKRINQTAFGKGSVFGRLLDFFTFDCLITLKLIFIRRQSYDVILGTTVPPLLSFIGVLIAKWKKIKFAYWVMDLQPELSISSGLIKEKSIVAYLLKYLGDFIINRSDKIISLDRFMTQYLTSRGANKDIIKTIPVWPVMDEMYHGERLSNPFRVENNFGDKIVIMYSGNHAYVHPLDTLLTVALKLSDNSQFLFVFVGGGVRKKDVTDFRDKHQLKNIIQLPFQPRENIHNSLGSSDIQVVILGDGQVGYTHPNKVYGAMYLGKPILYIGPKQSHVGDIFDELRDNIYVGHGEVESLIDQLIQYSKMKINDLEKIGKKNQMFAHSNFHPSFLKNKMVEAVVS